MVLKIRSEPVCLDAPIPDSHGTMALHGTLTRIDGQPPVATAVLHPGSGPTDRNGNSPNGLHTDSLQQLAELLAAKNVAVIRIDKRGVGESVSAQCTEKSLTIDLYASDLLLWHAALKARFNKPVYLTGHSEGALVALIAANQSAEIEALILLCATGLQLHEILIRQLSRNAPELVPGAQHIINELLNDKTNVDCPPELMFLFRLSVQPYWVSAMRYCPQELVSRLNIPVLIAGGAKDIQVMAEDTAQLAGNSHQARSVCQKSICQKSICQKSICIEQMSHTLKISGSETPAAAHYRNPSLPVAPELVDQLHQFMCENLRY